MKIGATTCAATSPDPTAAAATPNGERRGVSRLDPALQRLMLAHTGALQRYFLRRMPRREDAEEFAQEVFVRMLRAPDPGALRNPEGYLYAIAANLIKEYGLQHRRRGAAVALEDAESLEGLTEWPSYPEMLDGAARAARLRQVLGQLPAKCQAAVVMHYWHGMSYEEVGDRLGISDNMVKKYVVQALTHCRRRMGSLK